MVSIFKFDYEVIVAQAFHHALEPERLLAEVSRVLKRGGKIIVTGEHVISRLDYFNRLFRKIVGDVFCFTGLKNYDKKNRKLFNYGFRQLLPSDVKKGDSHYTLTQVNRIFNQAGFSIKFYRFKHDFQNRREWYYLVTKN